MYLRLQQRQVCIRVEIAPAINILLMYDCVPLPLAVPFLATDSIKVSLLLDNSGGQVWLQSVEGDDKRRGGS
jgi:hypothetical protein